MVFPETKTATFPWRILLIDLMLKDTPIRCLDPTLCLQQAIETWRLNELLHVHRSEEGVKTRFSISKAVPFPGHIYIYHVMVAILLLLIWVNNWVQKACFCLSPRTASLLPVSVPFVFGKFWGVTEWGQLIIPYCWIQKAREFLNWIIS